MIRIAAVLALATALIVAPVAAAAETATGETVIVVNQVGYLVSGPKRATVLTDAPDAQLWTLRDANGDSIATGPADPRGYDQSAGSSVQVIDFSEVQEPGTGYTLQIGDVTSEPFSIGEGLYDQLRYDSLQYFYLARSGIAIDLPGYEREAGHLGVAPNQGDTAVGCQEPQAFADNYSCNYTLDVRGGWYDAGDHGKYVVNGGISVAQLMGTYERTLTAVTATGDALADTTLSIPESGNDVPDVLDEARWELEWMLRMQVPAGERYGGLVHHKVQDDSWTGLPLLPSEDPKARELHRPSTAATLNLAAAAAQGSRLFAPYDREFSVTLLEASRVAWAAALATPDLIAPDADGSDGGGAYGDGTVTDEFYWAAVELYLTTGEAEFDTALHENPLHSADLASDGAFDWANVGQLARLELATVPSNLADHDEVVASVVALADAVAESQAATNFGQAYAPSGGYTWGSNSTILNRLVLLGTAFDLTADARYSAAVVEGMDYILGRNALGNSYVTGYGTAYSHNQHSRWFAHSLDATLPEPPDGTLAGGPNRGLQDPVAQQQLAGCADQLCYLDDVESWSTNEMTINWNASLVWVSSFLADQTQLDAVSSVTPATTTEKEAGGIPLLPILLTGGGLVLVTLVSGYVLVRRRRKG